MTKTIQPRSWAELNEEGRDLTIQKTKTEDNKSLMLSVFDSLNILQEKLNRLNYLLQRREIKRILYQNAKGETK